MVKRLRTTIMLRKEEKETLEKNGVDIDKYVKLETIERMRNEICDFIDINKNDVIFDNGFLRYEATIILAHAIDKEKEEEQK